MSSSTNNRNLIAAALCLAIMTIIVPTPCPAADIYLSGSQDGLIYFPDDTVIITNTISVDSNGWIVIYAKSIIVTNSANINADGMGYRGGGGGGAAAQGTAGIGGPAGSTNVNGEAGDDSSGENGGAGGAAGGTAMAADNPAVKGVDGIRMGSGGRGGQGGGLYGGLGGFGSDTNNGQPGAEGGYSSAGGNGDVTIGSFFAPVPASYSDYGIFRGSGSGGGGGGGWNPGGFGGAGGAPGGNTNAAAGGGGGGGCAGGGAIVLRARDHLDMFDAGIISAAGGDGTGSGGDGAGGGIVLAGTDVTLGSGCVISNHGGRASAANGGTLKIWYHTGGTLDNQGAAFYCGRSFTSTDDSFIPPEMAVYGNGTGITDGQTATSGTDNTDFGSTDVASGQVEHIFTITNTGLATLTLNGGPLIDLVGDTGDFSVSVWPGSSIATNDSTTFTIRFDPTAIGARTATVIVANNDVEEDPYTFAIGGVGTALPVVDNNGGATNVAGTNAWVNGSLSSAGALSTEVIVYWGTSDAGTDETLWEKTNFLGTVSEGLFTTNVTGLEVETTYYYRAFATNALGGSWSASTTNFTTDPLLMNLELVGSPFAEKDGEAFVVTRLNAIPLTPVTVYLAFTGTASYATDYIVSATSTVIAAGVTTNAITLTGQDDFDGDPYESVIVSVISVANAGLGPSSNVTAEIADDDGVALPAIVNSGVSNAVGNQATMHAIVTDTGGNNPVVSFFWGPNDGGTDKASWSNETSVGYQTNACSAVAHSLNPNLTYYFRAYATNFEGGVWAPDTVTVHVKAVVISEVMAKNVGIYTNGAGEAHDWAELHNLSLNTITLGGWYLTDDDQNLTKWQIPDYDLLSGEYMVIFLSGTNQSLVGNEIHANFKLSSSGEYLALVRPDGNTVEYEYSPTLPSMADNESYGIDWAGDLKHFGVPSPGSANTAGFELVGPPLFSAQRGFYTNTFSLSISSVTAGASIRYTTDFSVPSETDGIEYSGPINITTTMCVRAIAYRPTGQYRSSETITHTYIFYDSVFSQSSTPEGFPPNSYTYIYNMDPSVVGSYTRDELIASLRSIPTLSIVTDNSNLWDGGTGIYTHPSNQGEAWERQCHVEWIETNGVTGWALNGGLRIQGGASRGATKKPFSIRFKTIYGASKLNYPMFPWSPDDIETYDMLILRANSQGGDRLSQIRDEHARRLLLDMGTVQMRGRFAHLYVNGLYWGIYNPVERAQDTFCENYLGGYAAKWDCYNAGFAIDGSQASWDDMLSLAQSGQTDNGWYQELQGNNPDRTPNPNFPNYLDMENYATYLLANFWMGTGDWGPDGRNWYHSRYTEPDSTGFQWFEWDAEYSLSTADRTGVSTGPGRPYNYLKQNAEFKLLFADVIQRHMFNDGVFLPSNSIPRYSNVAYQVDEAMIFEEARWNTTTRANYLNDLNNKITGYFPSRNGSALTQLRNAGLYPALDAPTMSPMGGVFSNTTTISVSSAVSIYYTLDGSDPREYGTGMPSPSASAYSGPIALDRSARVKVRSMTSTNDWSALVEALFIDTTEAASLRITELMYHPRDPEPGSAETNYPTSDFEFIEFQNVSGEGVGLAGNMFLDGVDFDFGTDGTIYSVDPGDYVLAVRNLDAFKERYPLWPTMNIAGEFRKRHEFRRSSLSDNGERLHLVDGMGRTNVLFAYDASRGWPVSPDGAGHSLVPLVITNQADRQLDYGRNWRPSAYIDGSPGAADPQPWTNVVINEVMANTSYTNAAKPEYDSNDWIELFNRAITNIDLTDWYLSDSNDDLKKWSLPDATVIDGAGLLLFDEVDGFHSPITSGFGIDQAGERVFLSYLPGGPADRVVDAVRFKGQETDLSWGRYPDGDPYWHALPPSSNSMNLPPPLGVDISEIMYHPPTNAMFPSNNVNDEFIEVINRAGTGVDLWTTEGSWRIDGADFVFPPGTTLPAGGRLLIVSFDQETNTSAMVAFTNAYTLSDSVNLMGPYRGALSDRGERLAIERPQPPDEPGDSISWSIVDEAIYFEQDPWPMDADGTGDSLTRRAGTGSGNDPGQWAVAGPRPGVGDGPVFIFTPLVGDEVVAPFEISAIVDPFYVSGSVHKVEFFVDGSLIGESTSGPIYEWVATNFTVPGYYGLTAAMTDDSGTYTSPAAEVVSVLIMDNDGGSATVTGDTGTLKGNISGDGSASVSIYWGLTDGGTNENAWDEKSDAGAAADEQFSVNIEGLSSSRMYYYRASGFSAGQRGWAPGSATFVTDSYEEWQAKKMPISLSGYVPPGETEALTNFPALLVFNTNRAGFSYESFHSPEGNDLRFLDESQAALSFEIETWNTNGDSYVWVKVPELTSNTVIWAYWGGIVNTLPPHSLDGATWSENYKSVWHFNDNTDDAVLNHNAVDFGTTNAAGIAAGCRSFDGTNDYIAPGISSNWFSSVRENMTIMLWAKPRGTGSSHTAFGSKNESAAIPATSRYLQILHGAATWSPGIGIFTSSHPLDTGQWQMMTIRTSPTQYYSFKNGQRSQFPLPNGTIGYDYDPLIGYMGGESGPEFYFEGEIDELRISSVTRSSNWVWAVWENTRPGSAFSSYGAVQNTEPYDPDGDDDGLADPWEILHFAATNAVGGGPNDDWDRDGCLNAWEYIAGTDPTNSESYFGLAIVLSNGNWVVCFPAIEASGTGYMGLVRKYDLENRTNLTLGSWAPVLNYTNLPGNNREVVHTNHTPLRLYYRARTRLE